MSSTASQYNPSRSRVLVSDSQLMRFTLLVVEDIGNNKIFFVHTINSFSSLPSGINDDESN